MDLTLLDHLISTASRAAALIATLVTLTARRRRKHGDRDPRRGTARRSRPAP